MANALGKRLAEGATAEVFAWESGWIVKLFRDWVPADWADYEAEVARTVHASGMPAPAVGDVVELQGRRGILYERIEGPSLLQILMTSPWKIAQIASTLADLHVELHARVASPELPSQHERFRRGIQQATKLSKNTKQALFNLLETSPEGNRICHNDFHPDNILMTGNRPVIIDWMNAARGNPHADVARTLLLLKIGLPPNASPVVRCLLGIARKQLRARYLRQYCRRTQSDLRDFAKWEAIVAAERLQENHDGEEEHLLRMIDAGLLQD